MKELKEICISDDLVITKENVQTIGEKIAVSAMQKRMRFETKYLNKTYRELIYSLQHELSIKETISSGYDVAQEAICFLCNFIGHKLGEVCIKNIHGKYDCIRLATFKVVYNYLRRQVKQIKESEFDFDYIGKNFKINLELDELQDYSKSNEILSKLKLDDSERQVLKYYFNGVTLSNIAEILNVNKTTVLEKRRKIQRKYLMYV